MAGSFWPISEATGHQHAISDEFATLSVAESGVTVLEVEEAVAALKHEEHATINLAPGTYIVTRQKEYSPAEIRNVAD